LRRAVASAIMRPVATSTPRIALVGAGGRGGALLRALDALGALSAICDTDPAVRARLAETGRRVHDDYLALLADPAIDAVALATPTGSHDGMVQAALEAGKHVLVWGPPSLRADVAAELAALARQRGRVLMAGPALSFEPAAVALRAAAQQLGRLRYVHAERLAPPCDRPDPLQSFAPGVLAVVLGLDPEPPEWVRALAAGTHDDLADVTVTHLGFASGLRAHLHVSWVHPFESLRVTVVGEAATLIYDGRLLRYEGAHVTELPLDGPSAAEARCARFVEAVRAGVPVADDAVPLLRAIEAARRSLDEDRTVDPSEKPKAPVSPSVRIHPTAIIDGEVEIGEGTSIWHFSKVLGPARIGRNCTFGQNVVVERHVTVGDNVKIQNNVSVYSGVILEDDVFCGPSMVFTNVGTPRSAHPRRGQYATTRVKRGASIGANATVVCGHTLGSYCFVGAGAVVTRDVPDYALVYGNPARLRGWACFCGHTLALGTDAATSEEAACPECGRRYAREGHEVRELERPA
jgi:UDP-2-acetamido-3-amino-2,3-dideoxy-glucuronate N-acetyltransferase